MKSVYIALFGPQLVLTAASVVSTEYGSMAAFLYFDNFSFGVRFFVEIRGCF